MRCFGGPWHGLDKELYDPGLRTLVCRGVTAPTVGVRPQETLLTYEVESYSLGDHSKDYTQCAEKRLRILVVQGYTLTREDVQVVEGLCGMQRWTWLQKPSILYAFDDWWAMTMYKHRVNSRWCTLVDNCGPFNLTAG